MTNKHPTPVDPDLADQDLSIKQDQESPAEVKGDEIVKGRRDAVAKLTYASPVIAGLLFSKKAAAFSPPPPPGG